jgi:hypothetical protein
MKLSENITLILRGFGLAFLGAIATILYILGFTYLFIGRVGWAVGELLLSAFLFSFFYRRIILYLNLLNDRFNSKQSNLNL